MSKEKKVYVQEIGKIVADLYKDSWKSAINITEKDINYSRREDRRAAGIIALTIFRATMELGASYIPVFNEGEF